MIRSNARDTVPESAAEQRRRALLPSGLRDVLDPEAAHEADLISRMMSVFAAHGYDRVRPPLLEFEDSLLEGPGGALAEQTFRLVDPASHRMMGIRPDITPQVARIAATRLTEQEPPLRLSYAGRVMTVRASELRPQREVSQLGIELIGSSALTADAEVMSVAAEALAEVSQTAPSFDLCTPQLVPIVCDGLGLSAPASERARAALDRKDAGALSALDGVDPAGRAVLLGLLESAGPAAHALEALRALPLPPPAQAVLGDVAAVAERVCERAPDLHLTLDPVEFRGAEYQTGISFTIFARDGGELGRGGRYPLGSDTATGMSLFMDTLLGVAVPPPERRAVYIPFECAETEAEKLRGDGWRTVRGLEPAGDARAATRAARCTHVLKGGGPEPVR